MLLTASIKGVRRVSGICGLFPSSNSPFLSRSILSTISNSANVWTQMIRAWEKGKKIKSPHAFVPRYLLLTTEKNVNTPDWYREHICQNQIVIIWQHCVSTKSYQDYQDPGTRAIVPQSHYNTLLRELWHPFSTLLPPPGHGCCSLNFITDQHNCSRTYAAPASPSPSSKKGDNKHDNEGSFQPDQFPELSPTKSYSGTTKDARQWQIKLICISAAFFSLLSFLPALHSHSLPCASTGICLTCQPVQGAIPEENHSTPSKRHFLLGQLPWIGSLWAGGLSVPLWFCSLKSTSLTNCHEPTAQRSSQLQKQETSRESELLKPFLLPNALVQTTGIFFLNATWCGIRMTCQGMMLTQKIPHTSFTFRTKYEWVEERFSHTET